MSRTLITMLLFRLGNCDEKEAEVLVTYNVSAGYEATLEQPGEDDQVEIETLHLIDNLQRIDITWMLACGYYADHELADECLEHWRDDLIAAEEYKAEARAEDRRIAGWDA